MPNKLSLETLGVNVFSAMKAALKGKPKEVTKFLEAESEKTAVTIRMIVVGIANGDIDEAEAKALFEMQKHASKAVLTAAEGMGIVAAEKAINAGLAVIKDFVNGKIGFELI